MNGLESKLHQKPVLSTTPIAAKPTNEALTNTVLNNTALLTHLGCFST